MPDDNISTVSPSSLIPTLTAAYFTLCAVITDQIGISIVCNDLVFLAGQQICCGLSGTSDGVSLSSYSHSVNISMGVGLRIEYKSSLHLS